MTRGVTKSHATPAKVDRREFPVADVTAFGVEPPHAKQARFLASPVKSTMLIGGQGCGKTTALCLKSILMALDRQNRGLPGALCVPTYPLAKKVHSPMIRDMLDAWAHNVGYPLLRRHHRAEMIFELVNGSEIWLQSYERVDRLRSLNLAWAAVDEIERNNHPLETYMTITGRVRGKGTHQVAVVTTTKGYREVVKLHIDRVAQGDPRYQILVSQSSDNPAITPEQIELWRSMYSRAWFAQEVEAKILRPSSVVFPEFSRMKHVIDFEMRRGIPWSLGCDWGYGSPHFVGIAHVTIDRVDRDIVCWEYCEDDPPAHMQREVLRKIIRDFGTPVDLTGDRAVKEWNGWARSELGCPTSTMESREEQRVWRGIQVVRQRMDPADGVPRLLFARDLLKTKSERGIVACVEQYERERNSEGELLDKARKDNRWDNGCDALRYAIVNRHGHLMQVI